MIQKQWQQCQPQRQANQTVDVASSAAELVPQTGAIGGALTYTIRPTCSGYHLTLHDAITATEREWTATLTLLDLKVRGFLAQRNHLN
ncbi:hypothetical protein ACQ4M3_05410 [Leptolyngbya sp. AN03gr2]|uniref:hypothetical protein n=1 Tax=unclassified Leptolyngbya TaxID=2650499 RepID=UPI003D31D8A6